MKVLVTGATGFIGRHLRERLAHAGHAVRTLVRPTARRPLGVEVAIGDVTVPESLPAAVEGVDAVVYLAGVGQAARPATYQRVNAEGALNLARACGPGVRRFVYLSSLMAQGPSRPGAPHRTPGDERPLDEYAKSKLTGEAWLRDVAVPVTVLRPSWVYGPYDRDLLAWAQLVRARMVPEVDALDISLLHVDDLVRLIELILERASAPFGPFFVSDGDPQPLSTIVDLVEQSMDAGAAVRVPLPTRLLGALAPALERVAEQSGLGQAAARRVRLLSSTGWACLPDEATATFAWRPEIDLRAGIAATFEWYRDAGWL